MLLLRLAIPLHADCACVLVRRGADADLPGAHEILPALSLGAPLPCSYIGYVMLSTSAPGLPVWQTPPETWQAVLNESLNYFYINIGLEQLGLNPVPCVPEHPVRWAQHGGRGGRSWPWPHDVPGCRSMLGAHARQHGRAVRIRSQACSLGLAQPKPRC